MSTTKRLKGKCCVVTGAASGIGQGIVTCFAEHGGKMVLIDIADCSETIEKMPASSRKDAMSIKCDISNEEEVRAAAKSIKERFGMVDVLVNNAARFIFHSVLTASDKDWNDSLSINIKGHALCLKHVVPIMKRGTDEQNIGGSIVNMASVSSLVAQPKCITYAATKAAMLQITKNTALDLWKDYKIRVNAICPGTIWTPASIKEMKGHNWTFEEWERRKTTEMIMKRVGTVREVAFAALFFASDESTFCTGSSLVVDGGYTTL